VHELSLVTSLLEIVDDHARRHGFSRVTGLKLSFGKRSGIEPAALRFAFEVQSRGGPAEGAALEFDISPPMVYCFSCEQAFEQPAGATGCPSCNGEDIVLEGGTEGLTLLEMDVEQE
jgi:hydrogenase nickel incorporation protein HypA/HybF